MNDRKMVSVTMPAGVLARLDEYVREQHLNRSQTVTMMVTAYLDAEEAKPATKAIAEGFGEFMKNLFNMTPEEAKAKMAEIDSQMESLPESVKKSVE